MSDWEFHLLSFSIKYYYLLFVNRAWQLFAVCESCLAMTSCVEDTSSWPSVAEMLEDVASMAQSSSAPPVDLLQRYAASSMHTSPLQQEQVPALGASSDSLASRDAAFSVAQEFVTGQSSMAEGTHALSARRQQLDALSGELSRMVREATAAAAAESAASD